MKDLWQTREHFLLIEGRKHFHLLFFVFYTSNNWAIGEVERTQGKVSFVVAVLQLFSS